MEAVLLLSMAAALIRGKRTSAGPTQEVAPAPPAAPDASLSAEAAVIERGQPVTLKWSSVNATEATISGVGTVALEGTQQVYPEESTTYQLVATGPGGSATASATVNLIVLPPPAIPPPVKPQSLLDRLSQLSDIYFDYDKSDVREDARGALVKDVDALRSIFVDFPDAVIVLEGHCDERGSAEYNVGLGDRRASSVSAYLASLGLEGSRLQTISYGKDRPQCTEATEECWQKNRRVHFGAAVAATN